MSLSDYLAGYACGAASVVALITAGALAVARKGKESDAWFGRVLDPVPSHVRLLAEGEM
jgi:hypothetical protein